MTIYESLEQPYQQYCFTDQESALAFASKHPGFEISTFEGVLWQYQGTLSALRKIVGSWQAQITFAYSIIWLLSLLSLRSSYPEWSALNLLFLSLLSAITLYLISWRLLRSLNRQVNKGFFARYEGDQKLAQLLKN